MDIVVLRGLPGSGKTRFAKSLGDEAVSIFSADAFFEQDGVYRFDPSKIGEAHATCFRAFVHAVQHGSSKLGGTLVVDNTNIHAAEAAPYVMAGTAFGHRVIVKTIMCDPFVAWQRQKHGVSSTTFWSMYQALLSEKLPPFWIHTVQF